MPPSARKTTAATRAAATRAAAKPPVKAAVKPPVDPDEALAQDLADLEADAAIDELDDDLAAKIADEEFGDLDGPDDDEDPEPPATPAVVVPVEPPAAPQAPAGSPAVLDSAAAPLTAPVPPQEPAPPLMAEPPSPHGEIRGFVNPDGSRLDLTEAFDMAGSGPTVTVLRTIEIEFRPPGIRTSLQQLRHPRGSEIRRSAAVAMLATEAAIKAALGE